jgi:hypothetical protein
LNGQPDHCGLRQGISRVVKPPRQQVGAAATLKSSSLKISLKSCGENLIERA